MTRATLMKGLLVGSALAALPVALAGAAPTPTPVPSLQRADHLNRLKNHGAAEIDRRLGKMAEALDKVQSSSRLTDRDRTTIRDRLNKETATLTAIKTKLAAETDLPTARVDVQAIAAEYPVYRFVLPQARLMIAYDRAQASQEVQTDLARTLQERIAQARLAKRPTQQLQAHLAAMRTRLAQNGSRINGQADKLLELTPENFKANPNILKPYREGLAGIRTNDRAVQSEDVRAMVSELKGEAPPTATPAPTPTPDPGS